MVSPPGGGGGERSCVLYATYCVPRARLEAVFREPTDTSSPKKPKHKKTPTAELYAVSGFGKRPGAQATTRGAVHTLSVTSHSVRAHTPYTRDPAPTQRATETEREV